MPKTVATESVDAPATLARQVAQLAEKLQAGERIDLHELCGDRPENLEQLEMLLPTLRAVVELDHRLALDAEHEPTPDNEVRHEPQRTLGDFRLIREIGRGGMGVVYEAEQLSIGRRVALKVLPFAAMLDKQQLNRFKNEARAAGTLDHPNIVSVFSVGVERGVHYYAMQLVEGESLAQVIERLRKETRLRNGDCGLRNEESDATIAHQSAIPNPQSEIPTAVAALSTLPAANPREYFRTVARLGIQAAEALDHAHQNGILHRDVKPANLMVEFGDSPLLGRETGDCPLLGRPRSKRGLSLSPGLSPSDDSCPKLWITDFGLARLESDAGMTMTGDLLGTLRYMSPEQALAKRVVVDHRSDVYSLGATLYELLTLRPPFDGDDRQELLRQIAFDEPKTPRQVDAAMPRDLETIVLKALEKNPADRYATAQHLADELQRFISNEPIQARPTTSMQRMVKWSRRHPAAIMAAACALTAATIVVAACALLVFRAYQREVHERMRADASKREAQATARQANEVVKFLSAAFLSSRNPEEARTITIAEVLDQAASELENRFDDQPRTKGSLLSIIGRSYFQLGMHAEALPLIEQANELLARELGREHVDSLRSAALLGLVYLHVNRMQEAIAIEEATLALCKRTLGSDHDVTLLTMAYLAIGYSATGRHDEAIKLREMLLPLFKATFGKGHENTIATIIELAASYRAVGRNQDAIELFESFHTATLADSPTSLSHVAAFARVLYLEAKAQTYYWSGIHDKGIATYQEALTFAQESFGPAHAKTLEIADRLSRCLIEQFRSDEALQLGVENLAAARRILGSEHPDTLAAMKTLIRTYVFIQRFDKTLTESDMAQAWQLCEEALALAGRIRGSGHLDARGTKGDLADLLRFSGRFEEASRFYREALDEHRQVTGNDQDGIACWLMDGLSKTLDALGQNEAAAEMRERIPPEQRPADPEVRSAGMLVVDEGE